MNKFLDSDLIESLSHSRGFIKTKSIRHSYWDAFLDEVKTGRLVSLFFPQQIFGNILRHVDVVGRNLYLYVDRESLRQITSFYVFCFEIIVGDKLYVCSNENAQRSLFLHRLHYKLMRENAIIQIDDIDYD